MNRRLLLPLVLSLALQAGTQAHADAVLYGRVGVSVDHVDADANAAWGRPAVGGPSFDVMTFIDGANQALSDAGYTEALPAPRGVNTVVGDLLFGTIEWDSLDDETQGRILDALNDALTPGLAYRGWDLNANSRGSRIGVKGSEDLGNGLKAIYQVELAIPVVDTDGAIANGDPNRLRMRNSFVGLANDRGTLLVGRHDTPAKISTGRLDLFADTLADYNYTVGFDDVRADNSVLVISPDLWGFQLAGALIPAGGATLLGVRNPNADGIAEGWSAALTYTRGPLYASAAYEVLGSELWTPQDAAYDIVHGVFAGDDTKWRLGLGLLDWNGFTLTGVYESRSGVLGLPGQASARLWQLQAGYAFGNNQIKAMYGQAALDPCADPLAVGFRYTCTPGMLGLAFADALDGIIDQQDKSVWALGFDHNFSRRTRVYTLFTAVDDTAPDADWSGFSAGMVHSF